MDSQFACAFSSHLASFAPFPRSVALAAHCARRAALTRSVRSQGVGAYNAGDIQRAIQQFKSAAPSKGVLFNLGVSTAKMGDNQGAIRHLALRRNKCDAE